MKIFFIVAGAGEMICGACMHDMLLAQGLIKKGHEVEIFPLYTPVKVDFDLPQKEEKIYFSGINAYLEQHYAGFRKSGPQILDRLLESPSFLKMMLSVSMDVEPSKLGALTVSVLKGMEGYQKREVERLIKAMEEKGKPDIVVITNSMLIAIAPAIKEKFNIPVYCQLMGEEDFIEGLHHPYSEEAKALMRKHANSVDIFTAPSQTYAKDMAYFLAIDSKKVVTLTAGINALYYKPAEKRTTEPFRMGYLSRIMYSKGLDVLVDAFIILRNVYKKSAELHVAGAILGKSKKIYFNECRSRLKEAGLLNDFYYAGVPGQKEKALFLNGLSVFSVPSRFAESRGFAVLEAMASGIPVVLPDSGIYRDFVNKGSPGMLFGSGDANALAKAILAIMENPSGGDIFGSNARKEAVEEYSEEKMISETVSFLEDNV